MSRGNRFQVLSRGLRRERGVMNKTESAYADWLTAEPTVLRWWYEPGTFRLSHPDSGQPAKVTPDFLVQMIDGVTFVDDVKSGGLDDNAALVRMKCAAELYPLWIWRLVRPIPKRDGGGWTWQEV